jgi:4-oxalocrotonate tautomerase
VPFIDVRIFEERLTPDTELRLIHELTDAVTRVLGEGARPQTWVALTGSPAHRWGVGGEQGRPPVLTADSATVQPGR